MGLFSKAAEKPADIPEAPKKKKICCACPATKVWLDCCFAVPSPCPAGLLKLSDHVGMLQAPRDECVALHGRRAVCHTLICGEFGRMALACILFLYESSCLFHTLRIALSGPEAEECKQLIEAHKLCLRAEGFNVGVPCCDFSLPFWHVALLPLPDTVNSMCPISGLTCKVVFACESKSRLAGTALNLCCRAGLDCAWNLTSSEELTV